MDTRAEQQSSHRHETPRGNGGRWVFLGFAAIAAFFLLSEHRAHVLGLLPWLLVLACPLMHLFHRHGRHRHREEDRK